jgi:hypothetical protein
MGTALLLEDEFSEDVLLGKTIAEAKLFVNEHTVMVSKCKSKDYNIAVTLMRITDISEGINNLKCNDTSNDSMMINVVTNNLGLIDSITKIL